MWNNNKLEWEGEKRWIKKENGLSNKKKINK